MIGLGSYAFFWEMSEQAPTPLALEGAFAATADLGVELFQICDYAPLTGMSSARIADAAAHAAELGITIELGTKGIDTANLDTHLRLAEAFEAKLVRSMLYGPETRPSFSEAEAWLRAALPAYEEAGVLLALETYEQLATTDLVTLVETLASPSLGICLDPGNVVARLERPLDAVELCAPYTRNVHAKDFAFSRQPGWVGFSYAGAPLGTGLHDYPHLLATVRPDERGINQIVEHWLPWQGDAETTIAREREWTRTAVDYLRAVA